MTLTTVKTNTEPLKSASKKQSLATQAGEGKPFNLVEYFHGVRSEWTKISWPPKEQVLAETGVVVLVVSFFTLLVFMIDKVYQWIIQLIT